MDNRCKWSFNKSHGSWTWKLVQISQLFYRPNKHKMVINRSSKKFFYRLSLTIKHRNGNLTDVLYNASVYKDDKAMFLEFCSSERCYRTQNVWKGNDRCKVSAETATKSNNSFYLTWPRDSHQNSILGFTNVLLKPD
jgi:hypothetical protein